MQFIEPHIDQIKKLCSTNSVKALFAFGSVTRNALRPDSDIDLVVEIDDKDPLIYSDHYFELKFGLEQLFKRPIDLLEQKSIKNSFLKAQIDKTKVLLYGK